MHALVPTPRARRCEIIAMASQQPSMSDSAVDRRCLLASSVALAAATQFVGAPAMANKVVSSDWEQVWS